MVRLNENISPMGVYATVSLLNGTEYERAIYAGCEREYIAELCEAVSALTQMVYTLTERINTLENEKA